MERGLEDLGGDELPAPPAGRRPIGRPSGDSTQIPDPDPTRIPAGTAEGPGDPAITGDPEHETQERDPEKVEEPVTGGPT